MTNASGESAWAWKTWAEMELFFALWIGNFLHFCQAAIYTNHWALRIKGGAKSATGIAEKYGLTNMGQVP